MSSKTHSSMIPDKYKIKNLEGESLEPEETLIDVASQHRAIEVPIGRGVFRSFYIAIAAVLLFFTAKSFQMQIVNGEKFAALARRSSSSVYYLSAVRGVIYDTEGRPLAKNVPSFDLIAVHSQLPKYTEGLEELIKILSPIIATEAEVLTEIFGKGFDKAIFDVKKGLSKEEVAKIKAAAPPGVFVVVNSRRFYPDGPAAAHLLGYTSMVSAKDIKDNTFYLATDRTGRLGVEALYENVLRGERRSFDPKGSVAQEEPPAGRNLVLNVNREIQNRLYGVVDSAFKSAGVKRGAAVVQDPKTGAVLGLVSMPAFDGNIFENSSDAGNFSKISQVLNSKEKPLLNRVVSGRYSPGSTIKPLLALAGLKEGIVTPSTIINATGSIKVQSEVDPSVYYTYKDWRVHGWTDLRKAIADSVDIYFYALGGGYGDIRGLGIDKIASYLKMFGADKLTGIDLPGEIRGFVPSKSWKRETKGESWYVGDTYNVSIGQGDLGVTPIWLNVFVGSIANGGKLMKPFVVKEVGGAGEDFAEKILPQVLGEIPFDEQELNIIKQGMRRTVLSGTATSLQNIAVPLAAKTGTVQVASRDLNSLFTVFGPYDDPEIVMTVLVENVDQNQGLAVKIAGEFLLWYFGEFKK